MTAVLIAFMVAQGAIDGLLLLLVWRIVGVLERGDVHGR